MKWEDACIKTRRSIFLRKRRLLKFQIQKTDRVLDLACGDGLDISILEKIGIKNIVGIDISGFLLTRARKLNKGIKFYKAHSEKLPFQSEIFDVVLVDSFFHHLEKFDKTLREIKRVLVNGGSLCFIEPHRSFARRLFDKISSLKLTQCVPFIKNRQVAYLGEKKGMEHWLMGECDFLKQLEYHGLKKIFCFVDLLSIIGKYTYIKRRVS